MVDFGEKSDALFAEIEANEKLIRNQQAYGIPDSENEMSKNLLEQHLKLLENLRIGG